MTTRDEEMAAAIDRAELEDDDGSDDIATYHRVQRPRDPSQVYSVRIPVSRLAQLREVADQKAVAPTALIRQWVVDKLDEELRPKQVVTIVLQAPTGSADDLKSKWRSLDKRIGVVLGEGPPADASTEPTEGTTRHGRG